MKVKTDFIEIDAYSALWAKFRLGIWLMLLYLTALYSAYVTYPFVGHTTTTQNVIYGIVVAIPLWVSIIVYLVLAWKDLSLHKTEEVA